MAAHDRQPDRSTRPGVAVCPRDTDPAVHAAQIEHYRSLSPARKLAIVFELSSAVDALLVAGIRQRHPDVDDASLREEMVRLKYGTVFR